MNATESETSSSSANYDDGAIEVLFEQYKANSQCRNAQEHQCDSPVDELQHAAAFVSAEQQNLETSAWTLLKDVVAFSQEAINNKMDKPRLPVLEQFREHAQEIRRSCIHIHRFAIQSIEKYFSSLGVVEPRRKGLMLPFTEPWTYISGGTQVVTLLSDIFKVIDSIKNENVANNKGWVAGSSFERKTKKYWVNDGFLGDVMLSCVSEVPLLIYGKSGLITNINDEGPTVGNADTDDIWQCAATRITSIYFDSPDMYLYGRRVARIEGASLFRVRWYGQETPQGDQILFLELKTHHESWNLDKSIKKRVSLRESDMIKLLARDGSEWDKAFVENLLLPATPSLEGDDLREASGLLYQIRKLILDKDLRPCIRTQYLRLAFQSNDSNARRITIDRDITVSDESHAPLGQWCVSDSARKTPIKVSNAVLEVKLAENDEPDFVDELLRTGAIQDGHKFSKYLTGAMKLHSGRVKTMPYWAALPQFDELFGRKDTPQEEPSFPSHSEVAPSRRASRRISLPRARRRSSLLFKSASTLPTTQQDLAQVRRVKVEPKTYFANERTYIQWVSVALLLVTIATLLLGIAVDQDLNAPRVMSIALIFAALFIAIYAFAVYFRRLHLLTKGKPYGYIDHVGPAILTAAVLMGIVGMMYYAFTMDSSQTGDANTSYMFATADSSGECKQHNFTGISLLEYEPSDVVVDETQKMLIIPSQSKLTGLPLDGDTVEQQISVLGEVPGTDIEAITYANGMLYAVSESKGSSSLLAFEPRLVGTRTYLDFVAQWQLEGRSLTEAMTFVPDENGGKLYISEGAMAGEDSHVYVYDIPSITTSGTNDESIDPVFQLNGKVLTSGIPKAPKMGSMTFFEEVLYILHDNARVVRGWNIESGAMVLEWILPRVEGGFDQQWEGMTLQRVSNMGMNMAEGEPDPSSSSSVVLHMTLDSPPQIWSFKLNESKGTYTLPDCAAAY